MSTATIYTNPDMPDSYGYNYLQPPMSQQPNYNQQQGAYWNGSQVVNPFVGQNGMQVDNRRNLIPQPQYNNTMGMPMMQSQPQPQGGVVPFVPQGQPQPMMQGMPGMPGMIPSAYGQLPNQPQPVMFGNGVGTYGVEGSQKQIMAFNAMAENRRQMAQPTPQVPQFANPMAGVPMMQQQPAYYNQMMPQIVGIQPGIPNWGPMNPYTQPQTPTPPVVNFQAPAPQQQVPSYNQNPAPQFPGVAPNWMEILRMNWDY